MPEPAAVVCMCPGPSALMIAKSRAALAPEGKSSDPVEGHAGIRMSAGRLWVGSVDQLGLFNKPSGSLSLGTFYQFWLDENRGRLLHCALV